jgi:anti-sigma factor RsiW
MDAPFSPHPTDQTLQAYGLGKLVELVAEAVNAHLESCPNCRRKVDAMSSDIFLGRFRGAQAPEARPTSRRSPAGATRADRSPSVAALTLSPGHHAPLGPGRPLRLRDLA